MEPVCKGKSSSKPSFLDSMLVFRGVLSLKLIAKAPENGWLEYDRFLLGQNADFQMRTVSFRECISYMIYDFMICLQYSTDLIFYIHNRFLKQEFQSFMYLC